MKIAEVMNRIEAAKADLTIVQDQLTRAEFASAFRGLQDVENAIWDLRDEMSAAYGTKGLVR